MRYGKKRHRKNQKNAESGDKTPGKHTLGSWFVLVKYFLKEQMSLVNIPNPILVFESLFRRALILLYWGSGLSGELLMLDRKVDFVALKDPMIISPSFTPRLCCFS